MGYFEFLYGSGIICLPLNIPEKLHWQHLFQRAERQRVIAFILLNIRQYSRTLKNNIHHSNKRVPPPFFHSDTSPVFSDVLIHSFDKTHVLVVTVELNWLLLLNIPSLNFVPTLNKPVRLARFRISYVKRPAVILTSQTSYTAFLLDLRCVVQSGHVPFLAAVCPRWYCICVTYFCWSHLLLECC